MPMEYPATEMYRAGRDPRIVFSQEEYDSAITEGWSDYPPEFQPADLPARVLLNNKDRLLSVVGLNFLNPLVVIHKEVATAPTVHAVFTFQIGDFIFEGGAPMEGTMQVGSYATVSVQWNDASGQPVKVDGPTTWESSDAATVECTVSTGNPLIANLHAVGPIGDVTIQATADADMGSGVKSITATCLVHVIAGEAVGGDITFTPSAGGAPGPSASTQSAKQSKR